MYVDELNFQKKQRPGSVDFATVTHVEIIIPPIIMPFALRGARAVHRGSNEVLPRLRCDARTQWVNPHAMDGYEPTELCPVL